MKASFEQDLAQSEHELTLDQWATSAAASSACRKWRPGCGIIGYDLDRPRSVLRLPRCRHGARMRAALLMATGFAVQALVAGRRRASAQDRRLLRVGRRDRAVARRRSPAARFDARSKDKLAHNALGRLLVARVDAGVRPSARRDRRARRPAVRHGAEGAAGHRPLVFDPDPAPQRQDVPRGCRGRTFDMALRQGKYDQPVDDAYRLHFDYKLEASQPDYLKAGLSSPDGPLGTRDYRIAVEATPLDATHTILEMSYAYSFGFAARVAMNTYLSTVGSAKVGFSVSGKDDDGKPMYVGGGEGTSSSAEHDAALATTRDRRLRRRARAHATRPTPEQLVRCDGALPAPVARDGQVGLHGDEEDRGEALRRTRRPAPPSPARTARQRPACIGSRLQARHEASGGGADCRRPGSSRDTCRGPCSATRRSRRTPTPPARPRSRATTGRWTRLPRSLPANSDGAVAGWNSAA